MGGLFFNLDLRVDDRTSKLLHKDIVYELWLVLFEDDDWFVQVVKYIFEIVFAFLNFIDLVKNVLLQADVLLEEEQVPCAKKGHDARYNYQV
jgi:hypothetical protein